MEFVYNNLGYTKEQVLHSVIHMDEKAPHMHRVMVSLIKNFDYKVSFLHHYQTSSL